jgi:hypothetical protein
MNTPKRVKLSSFLEETKQLALLLEEQNQLDIDHANSLAELEKTFRAKKSHNAAKIKKAQNRLSIEYNLNLNKDFDLPKPHLFKQSSSLNKSSSSPSTSSKKSLYMLFSRFYIILI